MRAALLSALLFSPPRWREPATGMSFVLVPAGSFSMGTDALHVVRVPEPFYMGAHEVTQGEWARVTRRNPSAARTCGPRCPVENVSFADVLRFIARLNAMTRGAFRLPSEAEWEYACRAGTTTPFATGESLTSAQANYDARGPSGDGAPADFRGRPLPVGSFPPNAWGLHDMHGNVWEWCLDTYCPYPRGRSDAAPLRCESPFRVIRGGSCLFDAESARCGTRYTHRPRDKGPSLGFRLVRPVPRAAAPARYR